MKLLLALLLLVGVAAVHSQLPFHHGFPGPFGGHSGHGGGLPWPGHIPNEPREGQRCAGRNYGERRCCTPEKPCYEGEGDCDGPGDGGQHDGHEGCIGDLVCGSNNCKQFGTYYHERDDCCERPNPPFHKPGGSDGTSGGSSNIPWEPAPGQRCAGRNFGERRCCTPQEPCNEGEGDCDGPLDGGQNDGHAGCKHGLVCGSNNCKQFGHYYHEKDDCCERPTGNTGGWSDWSPWSPCSSRCGGQKSRIRYCHGSSCTHTQQTQERNCAPCIH